MVVRLEVLVAVEEVVDERISEGEVGVLLTKIKRSWV